MRMHTIPQNVTSYEDKIVGMFVGRQFIYLAVGAVTVFVLMSAGGGGTVLIRLFLSAIVAGLAVALALLKINDRRFDALALSYLKAVTGPTEWVWQKQEAIMTVLATPDKPVAQAPKAPTTQSRHDSQQQHNRERKEQYKSYLSRGKSDLDPAEQSFLSQLNFGEAIPHGAFVSLAPTHPSSASTPPPMLTPAHPKRTPPATPQPAAMLATSAPAPVAQLAQSTARPTFTVTIDGKQQSFSWLHNQQANRSLSRHLLSGGTLPLPIRGELRLNLAPDFQQELGRLVGYAPQSGDVEALASAASVLPSPFTPPAEATVRLQPEKVQEPIQRVQPKPTEPPSPKPLKAQPSIEQKLEVAQQFQKQAQHSPPAANPPAEQQPAPTEPKAVAEPVKPQSTTLEFSLVKPAEPPQVQHGETEPAKKVDAEPESRVVPPTLTVVQPAVEKSSPPPTPLQPASPALENARAEPELQKVQPELSPQPEIKASNVTVTSPTTLHADHVTIVSVPPSQDDQQKQQADFAEMAKRAQAQLEIERQAREALHHQADKLPSMEERLKAELELLQTRNQEAEQKAEEASSSAPPLAAPKLEDATKTDQLPQSENTLSEDKQIKDRAAELNKQMSQLANRAKELNSLRSASPPSPSAASSTSPALAPPAKPMPLPATDSLPKLTSSPNIINGFVFDLAGQFLSGAVVVVKDATGEAKRALQTNKLGQFVVTTPLNKGDYTVEVDKKGQHFAIMKVKLQGDVLPPLVIQAEQSP